jgi:hypothetical protein
MTDHDALTRMRRQDRAVTDDSWIRDFLARTPSGVIASVLEQQPLTHVNTFVYDATTHAIYVHTAGQGRFRSSIEQNNRVSFCASQMGRLLPADTAREFSVEFESVVVFGQAEIMTDMVLATEKMQLLMDKYFGHLKPGEHYRPITETEIKEISVVQISIDSWSAKCKGEAPEFPGAFTFGEN